MLYDIYGNTIQTGGGSSVKSVLPIMRSVNHRGYNTAAPENTIPAFVLSQKNGFDHVECDVAFTSDGVCVLLHDSTIDRTSDGSGNLADMTYTEVSRYDFGSWKSADYAGTKIPTFEEFIRVCKELQLHPYIEIKNDAAYTQNQIAGIVDMVKAAGMEGNVSYISFSAAYLNYVKNADPSARLGYVVNDISAGIISEAKTLRSGVNEVFVDARYTNVTDEKAALCKDADLQLEVWSPNDASWIQSMNPYITGVTSDNLAAEKVLKEKHITE